MSVHGDGRTLDIAPPKRTRTLLTEAVHLLDILFRSIPPSQNISKRSYVGTYAPTHSSLLYRRTHVQRAHFLYGMNVRTSFPPRNDFEAQ